MAITYYPSLPDIGQAVQGGTANAVLYLDSSGLLRSSSDLTFASNTLGLNGATMYTQIATPSNPAAGKNKLYFKSDGKLYKLTSGGVESEIGGALTVGSTSIGSGTDTAILFDDAGLLGEDADLTWAKTTNAMIAKGTTAPSITVKATGGASGSNAGILNLSSLADSNTHLAGRINFVSDFDAVTLGQVECIRKSISPGTDGYMYWKAGGATIFYSDAGTLYLQKNTLVYPSATVYFGNDGSNIYPVTGLGLTGLGIFMNYASADVLPSTTAGTIKVKTGVNLTLDGDAVVLANAALNRTGGIAVQGTNTNDDAPAGRFGEFLQQRVTSFTDVPGATTAWADATSKSLTAGDWDVTAVLTMSLNGATMTSFDVGISTTSGNDATGLQEGDNWVQNASLPVGTVHQGVSVPSFRMSLSGTTTVYLKLRAAYAVATPQYTCRLSARRVR